MYVSENGALYAVTEESWSEFLRSREAGDQKSVVKFGALLLGEIAGEIGDLAPFQAGLLLRALDAVDAAVELPAGAPRLTITAHRIASIFEEESFGVAAPANSERAA